MTQVDVLLPAFKNTVILKTLVMNEYVTKNIIHTFYLLLSICKKNCLVKAWKHSVMHLHMGPNVLLNYFPTQHVSAMKCTTNYHPPIDNGCPSSNSKQNLTNFCPEITLQTNYHRFTHNAKSHPFKLALSSHVQTMSKFLSPCYY